MAFVTAETKVIKMGGFIPALVMIQGTYVSSGGDTGGILSPGFTNSSGTFTASTLSGSVGARGIVSVIVTPATQDATTPAAVKAYNATRDRDEVTLTTVANATGTYTLFCTDNGQ